MDVSLVDSYSQFLGLKAEWNDLVQRSSFPHPQLTWEWFDIGWRHLKSDRRLAIFRIKDRGRLVGLAPLMVVKEPIAVKGMLKVRRLVWIAYDPPNVDTVDFIVEKDLAARTIESLWKAVREYSAWDSLRLELFSSLSPNFRIHHQVCRRVFGTPTWVLRTPIYVVPIKGSFEAYWETVSKTRAISDIDKRLRRLQESGGRPRLEVTANWDDELHENLLRLSAKRIEATGHPAFLLLPQVASWLSEVRQTYNKLGYWLIFLAHDDAKDQQGPIAYRICFNFQGAIYDFTSFYDREYAEYAVGKLLLKFVLEETWRRGARMYDFMSGAQEYKLQWEPEQAFKFNLIWHRNPIRAEAERGWHEMRRLARWGVRRLSARR